VQSNQLHACNLIRETARHEDQNQALEVRHKEAENHAKHSWGNRGICCSGIVGFVLQAKRKYCDGTKIEVAN
jgi:hypothetical protein